jgi:predicted ArsR family transcriptional regulator
MSSGAAAGRRPEVLQTLRASSDPMSINVIADALVVHPNTVRFHLDSLVGDGLVQQVESASKGPGRPALMFQAVRQMDRGGTRHYQLLAKILTTALATDRRAPTKALAAGRAWGHSLATVDPEPESPPKVTRADEAVDRLVDVLDEMGFAPERRESDAEPDGEQLIGMRHCAFLELAESDGNVVCPLHLGVIQGVLEGWKAPVSADRLQEFVGRDLCLLHLRPTATNN